MAASRIHTFYPAYLPPATRSFVQTYQARGLSFALAREVFHLCRSEESDHILWQQFPRRGGALIGMLPLSLLAIVETVLRVAFICPFFVLHWIPVTKNFYDRECVDLSCKSLSNVFIIMLEAFNQLAMSVDELQTRS